MGKESACNAGDTEDASLIPVLGRSSGKGKKQPTLVFLRGKPHAQRSLVGYSPNGHKKADMTKLTGK